MEMIADALLISGAIGAGIYCFVLSRRLKRFSTLENGVGGAVAVLSVQVDDLTKALADARSAAEAASQGLEDATRRANDAARRLELMMASAHGDSPLARADRADASDRQIRRRRRGVSQLAEREDAA